MLDLTEIDSYKNYELGNVAELIFYSLLAEGMASYLPSNVDYYGFFR